MTNVHLHLGVEPLNVERVRLVFEAVGAPVFVDGDGWEAWGEKPGVDVNNATTLHVIVEIPWQSRPNNRKMLERIAGKTVDSLRPWLTPMQEDFQKDVVAVLSDADNWTVFDGGETRKWT